ncbi:helix-turn-helix transcriptional regulator [Amycolatopsis speibonae]|uniref:LuxR C-terminal-related transcriptional regulator n=1 Tax=Amycolatopsis speibonae TaxID=1450224 RepID=A0ABV7P9S1_9PSEU
MERVRVRVCALDPITAAGMVSYLEPCADMEIVGGPRRDEADVVVAAFDRLSADAIAVLRRHAAEPARPVVLMVNRILESEVTLAVACRVVAVLPRTAATGEELSESVRSAAANLTGVSFAKLIERTELLHRGFLRPPEPTAMDLSARETEVLRLMADGLDTNAIAAVLSYSERTVKNIIYAMTSRLKLRNRSHAVAYAVRTGAI